MLLQTNTPPITADDCCMVSSLNLKLSSMVIWLIYNKSYWLRLRLFDGINNIDMHLVQVLSEDSEINLVDNNKP